MKRISALIGGAVLGVALLAACGGGGGGGASAPGGPLPPGATPTPPSGPSTQGFSASDAVAIPTPAPGATSVPVPLPSDPGGASANAAFPASASVPVDTTISATYSTNADSTVPALARARVTLSRSPRDNSTSNGAIAYLKLVFSADVTLPQAPAFSFVVPGTFTTDNGVTYWLGLYDPLRAAAGWQKAFEGPATVSAAQTSSGKAATKFDFASNGKPITFTANQTYYLVLLAVGTTTSTPTPVPSTVPTNPPPQTKPSPVAASPTSLQFASVTSSPQPVTFSEPGFSGPFTLYGNCTGIVNTSGSSPTWTFIPVGQGRCYIAGIGDHGASAVVRIAVGVPLESPQPTHAPTTAPTTEPSRSPEPTHAPTTAPTSEPTHSPTTPPTTEPTRSPTTPPTSEPTHPPTTPPTTQPTHPPATPTPTPTATPTHEPTHPPATPTPTPSTTKPPATPTPTPTPGSNPN
jgi:hypothetical protein